MFVDVCIYCGTIGEKPEREPSVLTNSPTQRLSTCTLMFLYVRAFLSFLTLQWIQLFCFLFCGVGDFFFYMLRWGLRLVVCFVFVVVVLST